MVRELQVRLIDVGGLPVLDVVDDKDENKFDRKAEAWLIRWELDASLAGFSFNDLCSAAPGFTLITNPVVGVIRNPKILPNGRILTVHNHHAGEDSRDTWTYMLRVGNGTLEYATTHGRGRIITYNNPNIINR